MSKAAIAEAIQLSEASIEKEDLAVLLPILDQIKPKVILEIGAWRGYSAQTWLRAFNPEVFITVENHEPTIREFLNPKMLAGDFDQERANYLFTLITKDSHSPETLANIQYLLKDRKVDFLFLDGDHSLNGVKKDFEMYSPLVRDGGIIAFHDALYHADRTEEVDIYWKEIKDFYPYREIKEGKNSTGIGVIWI